MTEITYPDFSIMEKNFLFLQKRKNKMTNLTEQEVCIGSLGQQKVYLNWSDVKDICTNAVSEAYEQVKRENAQLKELLKECRNKWVCYKPYDRDRLLKRIDEVLK